MKYHILLKFLAIVLCACALAGCIGSVLGIAVLAEFDLYEDVTPEKLYAEQLEYRFSAYANLLAIRYAAKNLGGCPDRLVQNYLYNNFSDAALSAQDTWYYVIQDASGVALEARYDAATTANARVFTYTFNPDFPTVLGYSLDSPVGTTSVADTSLEATVPTLSQDYIPDTVRPAPESSEYLYIENYFFRDDLGSHRYELGITHGPEYTVTMYMSVSDSWGWEWQLLELGYELRYELIWVLLGSLLVFALCATYLCCAAGRRPHSDVVQPGGFNRIPLDIYAFGGFGIVVLLCLLIFEGIVYQGNLSWVTLLFACVLGLLGCVVVVAFCFACAAQFKMPRWYFLRHSLTGTVMRFLWRTLRRVCAFLHRAVTRLWSLLPVMWQWLLTGLALLLVLTIGFAAKGVLLRVSVYIYILVVVYGAYCFGTLLKRTRAMSKGDLNAKIDDRRLTGSFREHAHNLNALADVVVDAAKKQMQSERMKAELVTNVSHDIKTPLTSIINYVDLLQKAENQAQAKEYVQVLDRQSQRLKKLIDDLMEMSKASTGNMAVDLSTVDPVEAVNQALGEFSEKLELANLTPILTVPEAPVSIKADGRLVWRVLSNLLSNTVKYALPGTRVYIDLAVADSGVLISLKNISREPLNVSAQELLERFVRGDVSRNTEGSGLGLNIAKSLMELQGGSLQLLVDGDLFKVTLCFPRS